MSLHNMLLWWTFCYRVGHKLHERTQLWSEFQSTYNLFCKHFFCHMLIFSHRHFHRHHQHQHHQCHHHHLQHQHQHHHQTTKTSITATISRTCKAAFLCLPLRRGRAATARSPTREITTIEPTEASHTELSDWTGECRQMSTLLQYNKLCKAPFGVAFLRNLHRCIQKVCL